MIDQWQPSARLKTIKARAKLLHTIRRFFQQRKVIEVETPLICQYAATAPYLDSMMVIDDINFSIKNNKPRFLQTSPEYAMKRLLAHFGCDFFQLCKAFRSNEIGSLHNPEFTMLEWYRIGFDHHKLMLEVEDLLRKTLATNKDCSIIINKITYREIFLNLLQIDPILISLNDLKNLIITKIKCSDQLIAKMNTFSKKDCQEILFNHFIEPNFFPKQDQTIIWFIYNYPKEQAALSKLVLDSDGEEVAERFEVYVNGIELANGYHELVDPKLQKDRFIMDQSIRISLNKPDLEIDPYLIDALKHGIPACSGVALGVDRLLMLKVAAKNIKEVVSFAYNMA